MTTTKRNLFSAWFERATISISAKTEADYRRVTLRLARQAMQRWTGHPDCQVHEQDLASINFGRIAEEMLASSRAPATKSKYVSALLWALRRTGMIPQGSARDHALRVLASFKKSKQRKTFVARARKSGRHIPETDLSAILTALESGRKTPENWASKTQAWLTSGIASGARPGEWEQAFWLDREQGVLRLPNLKLKTHVPFDWKRIRLDFSTTQRDLCSTWQKPREPKPSARFSSGKCVMYMNNFTKPHPPSESIPHLLPISNDCGRGNSATMNLPGVTLKYTKVAVPLSTPT